MLKIRRVIKKERRSIVVQRWKGTSNSRTTNKTLICLDVEAIPWGIGEKEEANDLLLEIPMSICERRNFGEGLGTETTTNTKFDCGQTTRWVFLEKEAETKGGL